MNNLELRKAIQKINNVCGEKHCHDGNYPYQTSEDGDVEWVMCNTCSGTGIDIPLEFGCEVLHKDEDYGERLYTVLELKKKGFFTQYTGFDSTYELFKSFSFDGSMGKWQNLGKPSTLEDLLRAFHKKKKLFDLIPNVKGYIFLLKVGDRMIIYDIFKNVETQSQEVINQLIELLS